MEYEDDHKHKFIAKMLWFLIKRLIAFCLLLAAVWYFFFRK